MNFKTTYVLFGLLACLIILLVVVLVSGPTPPPGSGKLFPTLNDKSVQEKDIEKIVITRLNPAGAEIVLERVGERNWKITAPRAMAADSAQVGSLLANIFGASLDKTPAPTKDSDSGMDNPERIVKLVGKGKEWTMKIGFAAPGETGLAFVSSSDLGGKAVAVTKSSIETAFKDLNHFRSRELMGGDSPDLNTVKLERSDTKERVVLRREGTRWRMSYPDYGEADIGSLLASLRELEVDQTGGSPDFVEDGAKDLAKYNLDSGKNAVIRIELERGKTSQALLIALTPPGKKDKDKDKKIEELPPAYYATLEKGAAGGGYDVVKITSTALTAFRKVLEDPASLRSRALVELEDTKAVDAISLTNTYGTLEFRKGGLDWSLYRGDTKSKADDAAVQALLKVATDKKGALSFPAADRKKQLGLERGDVVVLKIYTDSLGDDKAKADDKSKKDEKKKDDKHGLKKDAKPVGELRIGTVVENGQVGVERIWGGGTPVLVMADKSLLDEASKGPLAFLDRSIEPFNSGSAEEDVTKVVVSRDGETQEITRDGNRWKFVTPASLKDKDADSEAMNRILGSLNRPNVKAIVTEKATAEDRKTYGLDVPQGKAEVTLTKGKEKDKKTATHKFTLGKSTDKGVYFQIEGKEMVYQVGEEALANLKQDLRDKTIFSFKADDVTELKMTFFHESEEEVTTAVLEKKDGSWVRKGKDKSAWVVDEGKLMDVLRAISNLRAERFVKEAKGMDIAKDKAFRLELTLKDKKTYDLTLGAEDGGSYIASSQQYPASAFAISKEPYSGPRYRINYFRKK